MIGTGATAVQVVPHLAKGAGELLVFQRTPSSIDVRNQRSTSKTFVKEQLTEPGWQQRRKVNFVQVSRHPRLKCT